MRRFFVEKIKAIDGCCAITGPEAKHITRVLRMGRGDRIILMDGKGTRFQTIIKSAGRHEVLVTLERPLPKPPPPPVEITLCQALLKSRTMDYMVEKTSELGILRLFPFSSERTVIRLEKERLANKIRHWKEIAQSAAKQSDRATPAEIGSLSSFGDLVTKWKREEAIKALLWEEEGSRDLKALLKKSLPVKKFIGVVGPEGGLARKEVEIAREAGFTSVSLGYRVLRAETAAITMVAIVQYEWGDLSLNKL